jgi:hypothetical protein
MEGMTDTEMIDWMEAFVNKNGALLLHDGNSNPHGHIGIGLRPRYLRRTLREAIAQAALPPNSTPAARKERRK